MSTVLVFHFQSHVFLCENANASLGFGGTNAHAILESYDSIIPMVADTPPCIPFVFSAASNESLEGIISVYLSYIKETPSIDLRRLAYTLVCDSFHCISLR